MSYGFNAQPRQQPRQQQQQRPGTYTPPNPRTVAAPPSVPQGPQAPDYGLGVGTPPANSDIAAQYAALLASINGQQMPSMPGVATNSVQHQQTMDMYAQQMAANAAMQQQIMGQYDPNLGRQQHQQLMEMYRVPARRDQMIYMYGY